MKKFIPVLAVLSMCAAMPALANSNKTMHGKDYSDSARTDHWFKKIDTNGDGMISKSEHDSFGDRMFNEADTNNDGAISRDEMMAMKQKEHNEYRSANGDAYENTNPAAGPNKRDMSSSTKQAEVLGTRDKRDQ
jgi:hypothetical protein